MIKHREGLPCDGTGQNRHEQRKQNAGSGGLGSVCVSLSKVPPLWSNDTAITPRDRVLVGSFYSFDGNETARPNIRARMKRAGIPEIAVRQQTSELYEMTKEVNGQVENVQARIVQDARNHIIQMYGQGPVKVVQALECSQDSNKMELHLLRTQTSFTRTTMCDLK
eukprot:scaffold23834_cov132-Cylindrotheca_fusiformis.AAC.6